MAEEITQEQKILVMKMLTDGYEITAIAQKVDPDRTVIQDWLATIVSTELSLETCNTFSRGQAKIIMERNNLLAKEMAYMQWKIDKYEKEGNQKLQYIAECTLAELELIDGRHSHDPEYEPEFEEKYNV